MRVVIFFVNLVYAVGYFFRPKYKKTFDLGLKEFNKINTLAKIFDFVSCFKVAGRFDRYYYTIPRTKLYDIIRGKNINLPYILGLLLERVGYESFLVLLRDKKYYYDVIYRDRKGNYILWNYGDIKTSRSIKGCLDFIGKKKFIKMAI